MGRHGQYMQSNVSRSSWRVLNACRLVYRVDSIPLAGMIFCARKKIFSRKRVVRICRGVRPCHKKSGPKTS